MTELELRSWFIQNPIPPPLVQLQNRLLNSGGKQMPSKHCSPLVHAPQLIVPPQPSGALPRFWAAEQLVAGVQHVWFARRTCPAPQSAFVRHGTH